MNLKNQPTVFMSPEIMYVVEREWKMSKAAWMDVAWDLMQQLCGTEDVETIVKALKERADLIKQYRADMKP
jgi:hypothetical protein